MKKHIKELTITLIQLAMFYIFPIYAGPKDAIGMVVTIILTTFIFSIIMGSVSKEKIKYIYPIIVAIAFIPSIFIYYNESASIHAIWYLVISTIGIAIGTVINKLTNKK